MAMDTQPTTQSPPAALAASVEFELGHVGAASTSPDRFRLPLSEQLLDTIAKALVAVKALDFVAGEVVISLPDVYDENAFTDDGTPWAPTEDEVSAGAFDVASGWLKVSAYEIQVEFWDSHSDDALHGNVLFSQVPGLTEALQARAYAQGVGLIAAITQSWPQAQ